MPTIIIRCDGSPAVGMGHVVRCMALALALRERGARVAFVMRSPDAAVTQRLHKAAFEVETVAEPGILREELPLGDAEQTVHAARARAADVVLVDHYGAQAAYFNAIRENGFNLGVIDDVADRNLQSADWILNQNVGADALPYRISDHAATVFGPRFALLRPEFASARSHRSRTFTTSDHRVLITMGGGASSRYALHVLRALDELPGNLAVRCIVPGIERPSGRRKGRSQSSTHEVEILTSQESMAAHMQWADVSINAGGSTCWELCCMGVPMIVCGLSEDQAYNVADLEDAGVAMSAGIWNNDTPQVIAGQLQNLLGAPSRRQDMSQRGKELVDGLGATRAAESLCALVADAAGVA